MDLAAKAQRPPTRGLEAIVWRKAKEYGYPIRRVSPPSRSSIRPMDFLINGYRVRVHFVRAVMHPKLGGKQAYGCLRTSTSSLATTDFSIVIGKFERRKPIAFIAPSSLIFDHFEGKHGSKVFYLPLDEGLNRTSFWLGLIDAWYLLKEPPASMIEEEVVPYGRTR